MNFVPWHIGDYKAATAHLSNEEDIAYRRLLEMYYDTEAPIPADYIGLARRLRVELAALEVVLGDFFTLGPDGYRNGRADEEVALYHEKKAIAERAGKASGAARRNGRSTDVQRTFNGNERTFNDRSTDVQRKGDSVQPTKNQEPVTNNQTEPSAPTSQVPLAPAEAVADVKPKGAASIGTRLSPDWLPSEGHRALAVALDVDCDSAAAEFRDFWSALPGPKARKLDWEATFRNRLREVAARKLKFNHPKSNVRDHRAEKRSREFPENIELPDLV